MVPPELYKNPKLPAVVLRVGAQELRDCVRLTQVEKQALDFLAQFGFKERSELRQITRADVQVTTDRCTVSDVRRALRRDRIVCRSGNRVDRERKGRSPSGDPIHGTLEFGSRNNRSVFLRVYDKRCELEETEHKDRGQKFYYFCCSLGDKQIRQNSKHWDALTRFEYELKSKFFKDFDVKTFEDLERKLPSIVQYLTSEWFRIIDADKGNNHSSRAQSTRLWAELSETLLTFAEFVATESGGGVSVTRRTKEERPYLNPDWPKSVKKAEEFVSRALGEYALTCGIDDGSAIDEQFLNLVVWPMLLRRRGHIRNYVVRRGAGYSRCQNFLLYDSRDYYSRRSVEGSTLSQN